MWSYIIGLLLWMDIKNTYLVGHAEANFSLIAYCWLIKSITMHHILKADHIQNFN